MGRFRPGTGPQSPLIIRMRIMINDYDEYDNDYDDYDAYDYD